MRAAVILSGAGFKDGSEIHETVLSLLALKMQGISYQAFSLDAPFEAVSYLHENQVVGQRNQMEEAARLVRGDILPLEKLDPNQFDVLWIPGGFGVAKNLSTFAQKNIEGTLNPSLQKIILSFYHAKKPIVLVCIAPYIFSLALKNQKIGLTVGTNHEHLEVIERLGNKAISKKAHEFHYDPNHRIYSSPGYMEPEDLVGIHQSLKQIAEDLCQKK